jgi:hypothetical protein
MKYILNNLRDYPAKPQQYFILVFDNCSFVS